jgi:DGQHR domain-containing protein
MKIPYIKIKQRSETFYMTKFQATVLLDHINFHYREPYSHLEKEEVILKDKKYIETITKKGIELESNDEGVQRRLQVERINSIKKFIENDSQNFLPNTVLLSADISKYPELEEKYVNYEVNEFGEFEFPDEFLFSIIDGQHRLAGLSQVDKILLREFEIPAVILFNVSKSTAAKLFADINGKQKAVNKSLIYDLYAEIDKDSLNDIKRFHSICENLYKSNKSPLYRQIKMLGIGGGAISQAFFIDYVKDAVNKTGLAKRETQTIFDHLFYYFKAYQEAFPQDWPVPLRFFTNADIDKHAEMVFKENKSQLVKTNGFGAIMRVFPFIYNIALGEHKEYKKLVQKQVGKISWVKKPDTGTGKALQNNLLEEIKKCYR